MGRDMLSGMGRKYLQIRICTKLIHAPRDFLWMIRIHVHFATIFRRVDDEVQLDRTHTAILAYRATTEYLPVKT